MRFERLVERRILGAMEEGAFKGLAGEGRPLPARAEERLAGDLRLAHHVLANANVLPEWLELARDVERGAARLDAIERAHADLARCAAATGAWRELAPRIAERRRQFAEAARALRAQQDRYNLEAPGILAERPGVWVEERLRRLDARVRAAASPRARSVVP